MQRRDIIRGNLIQAMRTLLEACTEHDFDVECEVRKPLHADEAAEEYMTPCFCLVTRLLEMQLPCLPDLQSRRKT